MPFDKKQNRQEICQYFLSAGPDPGKVVQYRQSVKVTLHRLKGIVYFLDRKELEHVLMEAQ
jgi:hypothetical protein